jgi:O-antigen ligase
MIAYFALALSLATAVVLRSRVTFLALFASLIGTSLLIRPRLARLIATVVVIATLLLDGLLGFRLISRFASLLELGTRVSLWSASVKMFLAAPMLGQGPHIFGGIWHDYLPTGTNWIALPVETGIVPWPHNLYLELLSERGLLAVILFAVLGAQAWLAAWRLARSQEVSFRIIGCSVSVALMTFLFASLFELTFLRLWVVVIWFVLIAASESLHIISVRTPKRS